MCMYVAHWNIFMVNKCDLQQHKNTKYTLLALFGTRLLRTSPI